MTVRVVGVLEKTGASFGVNLDDSLAMSVRDAQQFFETGNEFSYIMAQADSIDNVASTASATPSRSSRRGRRTTRSDARVPSALQHEVMQRRPGTPVLLLK